MLSVRRLGLDSCGSGLSLLVGPLRRGSEFSVQSAGLGTLFLILTLTKLRFQPDLKLANFLCRAAEDTAQNCSSRDSLNPKP